MKALKYALLGFAIVALVLGAGVAYLVTTFDPRDYEPQITAMVKKRTGRDLRIAGEFSLSFWPDIGVRLGQVSLSERGSEARFADAETVRFTVKLAPLFSRTLVADDVLVQGAHVRITRFPDGRLNVDDLFRGEGPTPVFDVGRIKVERSTVSYRDMASDTGYQLSAVELETGRVASVAVTPLKAALVARDDAKTFDVRTALQGRLSLDLVQRLYSIEQATLELDGRVAEITDLSAQLKGSFAARAETGELEGRNVTVSAKGAIRGEALQATIQTPRLAWNAGALLVDSPQALLNASGAAGHARVAIASESIAMQSGSIVTKTANVEIESGRGGNALNVSLTSPIELHMAAGTLVLPKVDGKMRLRGPALPSDGIMGALAGHAELDVARQTARASLAGVVSGSRVKGNVVATGFAAPDYRFAVEVDQLDIDRFTAGRPARAASGGGFDLSSLSKLPATGTLQIGTLTTGGLEARNVKVAVKP